jgi:tetratricopeptide (TPR) repeat protein
MSKQAAMEVVLVRDRRTAIKSRMSSSSLRQRGFTGLVLAASLLTGSMELLPAQSPPRSAAEQAAAEGPGPNADAQAYVQFGAQKGMRGDLDGAISEFESAINLDPKFAPAYYNLGYAKSLQNKTDEALKFFDKAIALDPNYRDAYNQRGNLKGRNGDFAGAIPDFQQVVRIDPNYPQGHYNLGHVYYFTGDLDNSTKELGTALTLDPKLAFAYFIRGLVRHAQGHTSDATADFRKSVGLDFPDAAFWVYISESEDGLSDAARKDLSDALAMPSAFKPDDYPSALGNFLLGTLPQDALITKATNAPANVRADYLCAAWFYGGMQQLFNNNKPGARDCFAKAIATGSKGSEEYVEAKREMALLPGI